MGCDGCAQGSYEDLDHCVNQPSNASCPGLTDVTGCTCNAGYTGDGTATCTGCAQGSYEDSDSCVSQPVNASCPGLTDVTGCTCNAGYTGDVTAFCVAISCREDFYVRDHICTECPGSTSNEAGDQAPGPNTVCTGNLITSVDVQMLLTGLTQFTTVEESAVVDVVTKILTDHNFV